MDVMVERVAGLDIGKAIVVVVVNEWPDEAPEQLRPLAERLTRHSSARVRAAANRVLGTSGTAARLPGWAECTA